MRKLTVRKERNRFYFVLLKSLLTLKLAIIFTNPLYLQWSLDSVIMWAMKLHKREEIYIFIKITFHAIKLSYVTEKRGNPFRNLRAIIYFSSTWKISSYEASRFFSRYFLIRRFRKSNQIYYDFKCCLNKLNYIYWRYYPFEHPYF